MVSQVQEFLACCYTLIVRDIGVYIISVRTLTSLYVQGGRAAAVGVHASTCELHPLVGKNIEDDCSLGR